MNFVVGWEEIAGARFQHRMSDCSALGFCLGSQEFILYTHLKSPWSVVMPQFTDICILMAFSLMSAVSSEPLPVVEELAAPRPSRRRFPQHILELIPVQGIQVHKTLWNFISLALGIVCNYLLSCVTQGH